MSVPPLGIFSLRNKADHSLRRSLLSHAFSQGNLNDTTPLILAGVDRLMKVVGESANQPLDVFEKFRLFALDVVGELFLGASFGALHDDQPPQFLADMDRHFLLSGIQANFPWIYELLWVIPLPSLRSFLGARERMIDYGHSAYDDYLRRYGKNSGRKDLLTKILSHTSQSAPMTERETYVEISNLVFAGTDTTSTTLTYLFWELTRHPTWQNRVREEFQQSPITTQSSAATLKRLFESPILDAVVQEALRLHPAAPASLQRIVPSGGATLSSFFVPQDTVVSMQCYTTHRDPEAFPNPEQFDPSRWLVPDGATPEMKELFMPFSKGTRACLGKGLAMMELKLVTAGLLQRYEVTAPQETNSESMAMRDHFLVLPKDGRCNLQFAEVENP
ncbi:hypothetical protein LTR86_010791 [Recurvomyces mirabilis]|nr:hypothetical protein LTR86_010791 [Recurvomyces mirabilis]